MNYAVLDNVTVDSSQTPVYVSGGYVFSTIHNILGDVPPENILAAVDAVVELGQYPLRSNVEDREKLASDNWAQMARTLLEYIYLDEIFNLEVIISFYGKNIILNN